MQLADGQQLAVRTAGAGPAVVCVPGGPARAGAYLGDLGGLDATCTLHVLDTRGSGGSRPADPATLSIDRLARDLIEAVTLLGLDRPALLGHSFGTRVVAAALALEPGLAGTVVLVTPALADAEVFAGAREALLAERATDPTYAEAVEAARALPTARPRDTPMLFEATTPLWYGTWDETARAHAAGQRQQVDVRAAMTLRATAAGWSAPDLSGVQAPALVVAGSLDFLTPPAAAHAAKDLFADATFLELAGAGHFPWLDEPETFAALVSDFVHGRDLDTDEG